MNHEVEIKEMLAVARELMREWRRSELYNSAYKFGFCQTFGGSDIAASIAGKAVAAFDERFPKEAP